MMLAFERGGAGDRRSPAVVTEDLGRRFGGLDAVVDLSLRAEGGDIFGLVGPDGAGKTTTIKMLCGLLRPTRGRARVAGFDIASERKQIKRHTGYMAQTHAGRRLHDLQPPRGSDAMIRRALET